jgi:hypothetical protein
MTALVTTAVGAARSACSCGFRHGVEGAVRTGSGETQRLHGPDHAETLYVRYELASSWGEAGAPAGAARRFEELLADELRTFGPDFPDSVLVRTELAHWRGRAGDVAGAVTAAAELLSEMERVHGPDHVLTLAARAFLDRWGGPASPPP